MADMTDKAAGDLQNVGLQAGRSGANAGVRAGVKVGKGVFRLGVGIGVGVVYGTVKSIMALIAASHQHATSQGRAGAPARQVNLREFTRLAAGSREFMPVQDAEIARQFGRELRKHGVTFAIEKHRDGSRTFHVEGKDASVVERALNNAAKSVDEKIASARSKGESLGENAQGHSEQVLELNDETKENLAGALREAAVKEPVSGSRPLGPTEGWKRWEPEATGLAETVERDGRIPLTFRNVEIIHTALTDYVPTDLNEVKDAVRDEHNALAAVDTPQTQGVVSQDPHMPSLDESFGEPGWEEISAEDLASHQHALAGGESAPTQGASEAESRVSSPEQSFGSPDWEEVSEEDRAWNQEALAAEESLGDQLTEEPSHEQVTQAQPDNPFLRSDLPEQDVNEAQLVGTVQSESVSSAENPYIPSDAAQDAPQMDSPESSVSQGSVGAIPAAAPSAGATGAKKTQGQGVAQPKSQSQKSVASAKPAQTAKIGRDESGLSKRDETRKKVSERIKIKTTGIKQGHADKAQSKLQAHKPVRAPKGR